MYLYRAQALPLPRRQPKLLTPLVSLLKSRVHNLSVRAHNPFMGNVEVKTGKEQLNVLRDLTAPHKTRSTISVYKAQLLLPAQLPPR